MRDNAKRRFARIEGFLKIAEHAAFVSCREDDSSQFQEFAAAMSALYDIRVTHINIRDSQEKGKRVVPLGGGNILHEYSFDQTPDGGPDGYYRELRIRHEWDRILDNCGLSGRCG